MPGGYGKSSYVKDNPRVRVRGKKRNAEKVASAKVMARKKVTNKKPVARKKTIKKSTKKA